MLRQSSSRNYRSKKLIRPRHSFQAVLLFAVGIWIVYQLARSYGKRRAVLVETDVDGDANDGGEVARRRLGRKGFVGHAPDDDTVGVGSEDGVASHGAGWGAASSDDDPSSKDEDRDGGDEEEEGDAADEDDGVDDEEGDGIDGGDEEDDDRDFISQNAVVGNSEDELDTLFGESDQATVLGNGGDDGARLHEPKELNSSAVPLAKATGSVQDAVASQLMNATDGASDHSDSSLKNASAVNLSLHDRGTSVDAAEKIVVNGVADRVAGAASGKHDVSVKDNPMTRLNETADSAAENAAILTGKTHSSC